MITEPKLDVQERYVKIMTNKIGSKSTLNQKLIRAFKSSRKPLADKIKPSKLSNVVSNIAARKLLHRVLKARKQSVGKFMNN